MRSRASLVATLVLLSAMGAKADIAIPLTRDGALPAPRLTTAGLQPGVKESVMAAVAMAGRANRRALAAENSSNKQ